MAISNYYETRIFTHGHDLFFLRGFGIGLLYDIVVLIVSIVLNLKRKYYENCIICGTVVFGYILFQILNYGSIFLFQWLKLA